MAALGFELVFRFLWGSFFVLSFVRRQETSERFFRIAFWVSVGVAFFGSFLYFLGGGDWRARPLMELVTLIAGESFFIFSPWPVLRIFGWFLSLQSCVGLLPSKNVAGLLNFFSSALLLGGVYAAQYLGHWFLTVPGLNIKELKRVIWFFFAGLGLKTVELAYSLQQHWGYENRLFVDEMGRSSHANLSNPDLSFLDSAQGLFGIQGDSYFGLGTFGILLLVTRVLWGLLAPYGLGYMVYRTVSMRSTQSATGILYALCVMILVGEGAALYLMHNLGWNF